MSKPQPSVSKRQREQVKRDRQRAKAEKRAQRKNEIGTSANDDMDGIDDVVIREGVAVE